MTEFTFERYLKLRRVERLTIAPSVIDFVAYWQSRARKHGGPKRSIQVEIGNRVRPNAARASNIV